MRAFEAQVFSKILEDISLRKINFLFLIRIDFLERHVWDCKYPETDEIKLLHI